MIVFLQQILEEEKVRIASEAKEQYEKSLKDQEAELRDKLEREKEVQEIFL